MITALCAAHQSFGKGEDLKSALAVARFIQTKMRGDNGALFRNYTNGKASINAYLDDYAFLIEAYLSLYESTFDEKWVSEAQQLTDYCLDHFYDDNSGMFFYTSDIDPPLIARKQELMDNVIPASNSAMANNLFVLGTLLDRKHYLNMSAQMLSNIIPNMDYGQSFSNWGLCQLKWSHPYFEIAVTGPEFEDFKRALGEKYLPNSILMGGESSSSLPLLNMKFSDTTTIFVCVDQSCKLPVHDVEKALNLIAEY
jgi:hypothetical protein